MSQVDGASSMNHYTLRQGEINDGSIYIVLYKNIKENWLKLLEVNENWNVKENIKIEKFCKIWILLRVSVVRQSLTTRGQIYISKYIYIYTRII